MLKYEIWTDSNDSYTIQADRLYVQDGMLMFYENYDTGDEFICGIFKNWESVLKSELQD